MKNSHIAFWIAAASVVVFFYSIHQIHGIEEEASVWESQVEALKNPGTGSYLKAFFDGFTLGEFSNGDIFAEMHNQQKAGQELEAQRLSILSRYEDVTAYRNWGFVIGVGGLIAGYVMKKKGV
jgi:hypothetical protein